MIHMVEDEDVDVAQIAGEQDGHDLSLAVRQHLVPNGLAFEQQEHNPWIVALLDQTLMAIDGHRVSAD